MRFRPVIACFSAFLICLVAVTAVMAADEPAGEPDQVVVQHILIGFKRSISGKKIERTKRQAQVLARKLLERARNGEDFDALVQEFTDDRHPGIYPLVNNTVEANGRMSRDDMVPGFGDAAFSLQVGEVALVPWHGWKSPYGFHIIKRLE